jgi:hypothetical protein
MLSKKILIFLLLSLIIINVFADDFNNETIKQKNSTNFSKITKLQLDKEQTKDYIKEVQKLGLPIEFYNTTLKLIKQEKKKKEPNSSKIEFMYRKMEERLAESIFLLDYKRAIELKIDDYEKQGINVTEEKKLFNQSEAYIYNDEFDAAKETLSYIDASLEDKFSEKASLKSFIYAGQSFFSKWKKQIAIVFIFIILLAVVLFKPLYKRNLKDKIQRLEIEERMIEHLIKDTQLRYFKKRELSATIYNIKIDAYRKRLAEIKSKLPLYKSKLEKKELPQKQRFGIIKVK